MAKGDKSWPNTWTEVEDLGGRKFRAAISVGHRVFFDKADGNKPKKHKLTDERPSKDCVLIQSAKCCVEVHPFYAKYFDVQHEEVRLHEERWVVQRLFKEPDTWRDVDAYNPQIAIEEYPEPAGDVVKVTVAYDTDYGVLIVEYFQRDGNALKHNVTFKNTSGSTETFRVVQAWAGIVGDKCNGKDFPLITDGGYLVFHQADKPQKQFTIAENLHLMIFNPDGSEKADHCLRRPVSIESHAQGMKADFVYGNWILAQDESLVIDPDTATLDDPTEDGFISCAYDSAPYTRNNASESLSIVEESLGEDYSRAYVEWNVGAISDGSTITDTVFKYHGQYHNTDCRIVELLGTRPSTASDGDLFDAIGVGDVYTDPAGFPVVGTGKEQDLGTTADSDLGNQLTSDWFAIGIKAEAATSSEIYSEDKTDAADPKPTLYVEYTLPILYGTVSISAVPSLTALATRKIPGVASIAAIPSLTALATRVKLGAASIAAIPSLSALAKRVRPGVASISVVPSLAIDGDLIASGVASISAVSSLAIDGDLIASAVAAIEAVSSLSADGDLIASGIAAIAVVASLYAKPRSIYQETCSINVVPSLTADPLRIRPGVVSINAVASLAALATRVKFGECSIQAVASLVALALKIRYAEASISTSAALTAAAQLIASGAVDINAVASMTVDGDALRSAITSIQATPSMTAAPIRKRPGEVSINSVPSVAIDGDLIASGVVDIDVISAISIVGHLIASGVVNITNIVTTTVVEGANRRSGFCTITNTPSLTADPLRIRQGAAAIDAVSSLAIDGDLIASAIAAIEAAASMSATPLKIRPGACSINSAASLAADGDAIMAGIVAIAIVSSLTAGGNLIADGVVSIEAIASLLTTGIAVRKGEVEITANSSLAVAALAYITQSLGYTGTLTAGDVLEIDVDKMTVKLNGVNARANFTGVFPLLYTGDNELRWKDEDGSRDVDLEVTHKPRWI